MRVFSTERTSFIIVVLIPDLLKVKNSAHVLFNKSDASARY